MSEEVKTPEQLAEGLVWVDVQPGSFFRRTTYCLRVGSTEVEETTSPQLAYVLEHAVRKEIAAAIRSDRANPQHQGEGR